MKTLKFAFVFMLAAVLLAACAPAAAQFVQFPESVQLGITAVVIWAIAFFFAKLIALVPFLSFLEDFREPVSLAVSAALIGWIQNVVPDAYGQIAITTAQLILAILAAVGVGKVLKARGVKGFK